MPQDEEFKDVESSATPEQDGHSSSGDELNSAGAATSSSATGEETSSILDIVRDVVDKQADSKAESPPEGEIKSEDNGLDDEQPVKELDDENFSDTKLSKHPRFQQVIRQRNDLRKEVETYRHDAQLYRNVNGFLEQNGISADEAGETLVVAALMKTNPQEAWNRIRPRIQQLLIDAGEVLPEAVQARVNAGELSPDTALELTRAQATAQALQAQNALREQQYNQQRHMEHAARIDDAATSWVQDRLQKDPNFAAKQDTLIKEVLWLQQTEGKPQTPDKVKDQLQRAYKAINTAFAPQSSAPRPAVRPVVNGQPSGETRPSALSTADVIAQYVTVV